MKKLNVLLGLTFLVGLIATIANSLGRMDIVLPFRLAVIPLLAVYYFSKSQKKNLRLILILLLSFASDVISFTYLKSFSWLLIIGLFVYLLFLVEGIQNLKKFKPTVLNIFSISFVILFVGILYFSVLDLAMIELAEYRVLLSIYGIVLGLNVVLAAYNLTFRNYATDFLYFLCVASFLLTDIFYLMNEYFVRYPAIVFINFFLQLLSYYFMVNYFLVREKGLKRLVKSF